MNSGDLGSPHDERALAALDAYVDDLQAGRHADRERLLREFPDLAGAVRCLEALERLALSCSVTLPATPNNDSQAGAPELRPEPPAVSAWQPLGDFGDYELLEELGRGGMGVVYKARHKTLGRLVALKMILPTQLRSEQAVLRFQAEARAAARVRHPNVVAVHEVGEWHGQPYFTMDYVAGRDLSALASGQPMQPKAAVRLMAQAAAAVEHLHAHGIVHRDLKPSNILIDDRGCAYITDFGLALACGGDGQLTQSGMIVGTPSYMSPEQAAGKRQAVGPAADVYSLGAILYELVTGQPPFSGPTPLETLVQVLEGEPVPPRVLNRRLPRELELVILRCLEKRPEARYASAGALAADLERFLREEPVEARPRGPLPRLVRWGRRHPALAIRLAAMLLFAVVAHVSYTLLQQVDWIRHTVVLAAMGVFAAAGAVFEWAVCCGRYKLLVPFVWSTADMLLASSIIWVTQNQFSPLVVAFPLLVATSGLWFRVRLVWYTTALASLAYSALTIAADPPDEEVGMWHHHLIFVAALAMVGAATAYQVWRVRALSRYYERWPLGGG